MIHALAATSSRYASLIEASRRVRWDTDRDVIRGRTLDLSRMFLPVGLSLVDELGFLRSTDRRLLSQVQARTYVNLLGLFERFIGAKRLEMTRAHWLGDQQALEALVRTADEELKHQALFRRIDEMLVARMPVGYACTAEANAVAEAVLGKSTWSVLALTLAIELVTQAHYHASIESDADLCELWKDIFLFHWREESQHALVDEFEFQREDRQFDVRQRDAAVGDLVDLFGALDTVLQFQARADAAYFTANCAAHYTPAQQVEIRLTILKAYRWQYLLCGVMQPRFRKVLFGMLDETQSQLIEQALAPFAYAVPLESFQGQPRRFLAAA